MINRISLFSIIIPIVLLGCSADPLPDETRSFPSLSQTAPSKIVALPADNQITLNWAPVPNATSYSVFRVDENNEDQAVGNSPTNRFVDESTVNGVRYTYRVASNFINIISPKSEAVTSTPIQTSSPADEVSEIEISALDGSLLVDWSDSRGALSYNIYYGENGELDSTVDLKLTSVTPPHVIDNLNNGTTYYVAIAAVNDLGETSLSQPALGVPTEFKSIRVDNLQGSAFIGIATDSNVRLTWPATSNEQYHIRYKTEGTTWQWIEDAAPNFNHSDLSNHNTIQYQLYTGAFEQPVFVAETSATPSPLIGSESFFFSDINLQNCFADQQLANGALFVADVKQLDCSGRGIANLDGLEGYPYIENLDLSHNVIVDTSPLSALSELEILNLYNNQITTVTALTQLSKLKKLALDYNPINDIGPLLNNNSLIELGLSGVLNDIQSDEVSISLNNLRELRLSAANVEYVEEIATITSLRYLDLSDNYIIDTLPLTALTNLVHLDLSRNLDPRSINFENSLPNLKYFNQTAEQVVPMPRGLSGVLSEDQSTINLQWNRIESASEYIIFQLIDGSAQEIARTNDIQLDIDTSGLNSTPTIELAVASFSSTISKQSELSDSVTISIDSDDATPSLNANNITQNSVDLTWALPNSAGTPTFILSQFGPGQEVFQVIASGTETSLTVTGLLSSSEYIFELYADNGDDSRSETASVTITTLPVEQVIQAPTSLNAIETPAGVTVSWVNGDVDTQIYRSISATPLDEDSILVTTILTSDEQTSFTDTGITPGTEYYYHLRSIAESDVSDFATVAIQTAPLSPSELTIAPLDESPGLYQLNWDAVAQVDSYEVYADNQLDLDFQASVTIVDSLPLGELIYTGDNTTTTINLADFNSTVIFRVFSIVNNVRSFDSAFTNLAIPDLAQPLLTYEVNEEGILFAWNAVPGAQEYELSIFTEGFEAIYTGENLNYLYPVSEPGTYTFNVVSQNALATSTNELEVDVTWQPVSFAAPSNFFGEYNGDGGYRMSWEAVPDATGYQVTRTEVSTGTELVLGVTDGNGWTDGNFDFAQAYDYTLTVADNNDAGGNASVTLRFGLTERPPGQISNLNFTSGNGGISVTWSDGLGADSYAIDISVSDTRERNNVPEGTILNGFIETVFVTQGEEQLIYTPPYPLDAADYTFEITSINDYGDGGFITFTVGLSAPLTSELTFADQAFADCIGEMLGREQIAALVETLPCQSWNITDISGIEQFPAVRNLLLSDNPITDLSPLTQIKNVELADLSATNIAELSAIKEWKNLIIIIVKDTPVADASALAEINTLVNIDIQNTGISSLDFVGTLSNLIELNASENTLDDVSALANAVSLKKLLLNNTGIDLALTPELLTADSSLLQLNLLEIAGTPITNLDFVALMPELVELNAANTLITRFPSFGANFGMTRIDVSGTAINQVINTTLLRNLEILDVSNTQVGQSSFVDFQELASLTEFYARDAGINDSHLGWLELTSSNLSIIDVSNDTTTCCNVENQDPQANDFTDNNSLTGLSDLPNLTEFSARNTNVTDVRGLIDSLSINVVDLVGNDFIECFRLDDLEIQLLQKGGQLKRPDSCIVIDSF